MSKGPVRKVGPFDWLKKNGKNTTNIEGYSGGGGFLLSLCLFMYKG